MAKVDALLAAHQPKIAFSIMSDMFSATITRFATLTGMIVPSDDIYEKTLFVLGQASKACGNPSLAARLDHCALLVYFARTSSGNKLAMDCAGLLYKALA